MTSSHTNRSLAGEGRWFETCYVLRPLYYFFSHLGGLDFAPGASSIRSSVLRQSPGACLVFVMGSSTPLMILTQQRCSPIGVRVRNQGCSSNQTWLAVLSSLSCSLSSSSSSCSSVAPLLMQQTWQYSGSPQVLHSTLYSGNESSHQ